MEPHLFTIARWIVPAVAVILIHDRAQATMSRWMGEPFTPAPLWRAIDPVGTLMIPMALALAGAPVFGWGRARVLATGEDATARRRRVTSAMVGPLACFLAALAGAFALGALVAAWGAMPDRGVAGFLAANLFNFILAGACMATFHLLPVPPFDLGRALSGLLPLSVRDNVRFAGRLIVLIVVAVVVAIPLLDPDVRIGEQLAAPIINAITRFVLGLVNLTV